MPAVEDTVEFQALTLNDLLEADAKAVALPSESEGKYRSWAYVSTAAAGLLAILLVVTLIMDSGGGGGAASDVEAKTWPGRDIHRTLRLTEPPSNLDAGAEVSVYKAGQVVVAPVGLAKVVQPKGNTLSWSAEVAMTKEQAQLYNKAFAGGDKGTIQAYAGETVPAESAPTTAETTPPATPAETAPPATTAPAATPESTPPASG